jgi:RimJ/RimL family protein N-acetyltransferase
VKRAFLVGDKLYLRPLEPDDLTEDYLAWLHDPDVTRYLETGRFPTTPAALRAYLGRFETATDNLAFAIVDKATDLHVGNVTLNNVNWVHRRADTGLMIGRREFWGRGFAFEAWTLLIDYAFERLGLRKIIAGVVVDNAASVAVLERLGFQVEGRLREDVLVDGVHRDCLRLGMFRDEFHKYRKGK